MKNHIETMVLGTALSGALLFTLVGCSKPVDSGAAPVARTTVGTDIDDSVITSRVKSALLADPDIKSFDFKVETRKGEVMLSGFVESQAQVDKATAATRAVEGVKSVQNNVLVKDKAATVGSTVDAGMTTSKVKAALLAEPSIKSQDIAVVTHNDEVLLSGFVDSKAQMDRAVEIARATEGVRLVSNEMSVKK
jgi:hyperosmotically inducible periplasmic protein